MDELTEEEIERQDFVDNSIFALINGINPTTFELEWNIEMISEVRDVISDWLTNNLKICKEREFYPYIEEI